MEAWVAGMKVSMKAASGTKKNKINIKSKNPNEWVLPRDFNFDQGKRCYKEVSPDGESGGIIVAEAVLKIPT